VRIEAALAYFFDYTCDKCRHLHSLIASAVLRETALSALLLPVPWEQCCNPHVTCRNRMHFNACAYARLGLSVWLSSPQKYFDYDRFVFGEARPPKLSSAVGLAEQLLGRRLYDPEIADPDIDPLIQQAIEMFHSLGFERTPVLLLQNGILQGHVSDLDALSQILLQDAARTNAPPGVFRL
jgi:hypothetical protein